MHFLILAKCDVKEFGLMVALEECWMRGILGETLRVQHGEWLGIG